MFFQSWEGLARVILVGTLVYDIGAVLLGGRFLVLSFDLLQVTRERGDLRLYKFSLLYLALLFMLMTLDRVAQTILS